LSGVVEGTADGSWPFPKMEENKKGQLAPGRPRDPLLSVPDNSGAPQLCPILVRLRSYRSGSSLVSLATVECTEKTATRYSFRYTAPTGLSLLLVND